jgi:hypothetical protein
MAICDNCGNDYHRTFEVRMNGEAHTFDCFECAIQSLAPTCKVCGTRIIGHGVEAESEDLYCCAHCAARDGVPEAVDHVRPAD